MRLLIGCVLIAAMSTAMAAAKFEDEIRAAEKKWSDALVAKDVAALERIYDPALIYAHSTGKVETKAEYLERLKGGKQRYDSFASESMKVVVYGDSALTHSISRATGQNDSGPFNDHLMVIHMWVKRGGEWRLAGHQTTKIP